MVTRTPTGTVGIRQDDELGALLTVTTIASDVHVRREIAERP